ncbi:MAG: hypothetical protein H7X95_09260 [Deltaproteobacteria bacterium]|nr:hypothetical protein [Deltaproteobacteria bacterium]
MIRSNQSGSGAGGTWRVAGAGFKCVTLAAALTLTSCAQGEGEGVDLSGDEDTFGSALTSPAPFNWQFTESFAGGEKVALARQFPHEGLRDVMVVVRRNGTRLEEFTYLEDEELFEATPGLFGPTNVIGTPSIVNTGNSAFTNNMVILVKTAAGRLELGQRSGNTGWKVLSTFGSGLATSNFGNPVMAFNPATQRLEVAYREGERIRHWNGRRNSDGTYTWVNALISGTGGTGTKVISALGLAVSPAGKLTVVARRAEKNLRSWTTGGSTWPFTWTTGSAFGFVEESTEAPSVAIHGDSTAQVVAVGKRDGTNSELVQFEIKNNVPAFVGVIKGFDHNGPVTSTGHSHPSVAAMDASSLVVITGYKGGGIIGVGIR